LAFGKTTKYIPVQLNEIKGGLRSWNSAIENASHEFSQRMHNLICNNCHDHVAHALNNLEYKGSKHWNSVTLGVHIFFHGKHPSIGRFLITYIPFMIFVLIWVIVIIFFKFLS